MLVTVYFAGMVVQDMLVPSGDPVRTDGFADDEDDPGGGVYDRAPDVFTLRRSSSAPATDELVEAEDHVEA